MTTKPGSTGIKILASSKAINRNKITEVFGNLISDDIIDVDFRYCKPGEQLYNEACRTCSPGTYSLEWNSPKCFQCMNDVVCEGGAAINVNPGYWRKSSNSTSIFK